MREGENHIGDLKVSREQALLSTKQQVERDIAPIAEEDPETSEFYRTTLLDARMATFDLLRWIDESYTPLHVIYPGSGLDKAPRLAFGDKRVVQTSMERFGNDNIEYFQENVSPQSVVADNTHLPFKDQAFNAVCLLDTSHEVLGPTNDEYFRTLREDGLIILSTNMYDLEPERIEQYRQDDRFEEVEVPAEFNFTGDSQSQFFLFRKKHVI